MRELTIRQRRKLGITRKSVRQEAIALVKGGVVANPCACEGEERTYAVHDLAEAIAMSIATTNAATCRSLAEDVGADWGEFFDSLVAFIERILPLILKLIEMFGMFA